MEESKKQSLSELKVVSFVTTLEDNDMANIKGGSFQTNGCGSAYQCPTAGCCSTSDRYGTLCYTMSR